MNTEIQKTAPTLDTQLDKTTLFQVVTSGDTSSMTADQKLQYYKVMCEGSGLDPRTVPFQFIKTKNGEKLYATKSCTNQLSKRDQVSFRFTKQEVQAGILMMYGTASTLDKRETEEVAAVPISGLAGDDLANAMMKCSTKCKRRAVLSHCGLGVLDETEADTMGKVEATYVPPLPSLPAGQPSALEAAKQTPQHSALQAAMEATQAPAPAPPTPAAPPPEAPAPRRGRPRKEEPPAAAQPAQAAPVDYPVGVIAAAARVGEGIRKAEEKLQAPAPQPPPPPPPAPPAPAPVQQPLAPQPAQPPAQPGKRRGLSERLEEACGKVGTSLQNGIAFMKTVLGSELEKADPIRIRAVLFTVERYAETMDRRNVQALLCSGEGLNTKAAWMDDQQWKGFIQQVIADVGKTEAELKAKVGK